MDEYLGRKLGKSQSFGSHDYEGRQRLCFCHLTLFRFLRGSHAHRLQVSVPADMTMSEPAKFCLDYAFLLQQSGTGREPLVLY